MVDRLLLRVPEAARMLEIGASTLYQMVLAGEIPHVRFGRAVRIPRAALERWLEEQMQCGDAANPGQGSGLPGIGTAGKRRTG